MKSLKMGFIGLGDMGMTMAKGLVKKGIPLSVYDLRKEAIDEIVLLGAKAAKSPKEVALNSDAVITMVRDAEDTDAVIFGKDGVWSGIKEGGTIIVTSTIGPKYCRELAQKTKSKKVTIIEGGLSKSDASNKVGELTLMVGGDEKAVTKYWDVFTAMGKHVFYCGDIGMGQAYKLINNLTSLACGTVTREALNVGIKAGLDLRKMLEIMKVSTGESWMLRSMEQMINSPVAQYMRKPPVDERPEKNIGIKDKRLAFELAKDSGAEIPVTLFIEEVDTNSKYAALSAALAEAMKSRNSK